MRNLGSCSTSLHTLSEVFVSQFKQKLIAEKVAITTQFQQFVYFILFFYF